jgi:hypothetical protein
VIGKDGGDSQLFWALDILSPSITTIAIITAMIAMVTMSSSYFSHTVLSRSDVFSVNFQ